MRIRLTLIVLLFSLGAAPAATSTRSAAETESWRAQRERDLRSDTGWLTVAGLAFLKPGTNTVGSDRDSDVLLPPAAPRHAGELTREERTVWFTPAPGPRIFSDATAGRETYRIRFLYADAPSPEGRVTLDFNRAYNPPCAYNPFTTCPVPPPQNRLKVAIPAGERKYDRAH